MPRPSVQVPATLLEAIYKSAADPALWPSTLESMITWTGGVVGTLLARAENGPVFIVTHGTDDDTNRQYAEYYHTVDPHLAQVDSIATHRAFVSQQILAPTAYARSEFYNDFCKPRGVQDLQGVVVLRNERWLSTLSMFAPPGAIYDQDSRAKLSALTPHVERALRLSFDFEVEYGANATLEAVARLGSVGYVRVDQALNCIEVRAADHLYACNSPLVIVNNQLGARDHREHEQLVTAIRRAAHGETGHLLLGNASTGLARVSVIPGPLVTPFERVHTALVLFKSVESSSADESHWPELSPALRAVAELLAAGQSDKDIANRLALPLATVRTYAARILKRLNMHSRRELMRRRHPSTPT